MIITMNLWRSELVEEQYFKIKIKICLNDTLKVASIMRKMECKKFIFFKTTIKSNNNQIG